MTRSEVLVTNRKSFVLRSRRDPMFIDRQCFRGLELRRSEIYRLRHIVETFRSSGANACLRAKVYKHSIPTGFGLRVNKSYSQGTLPTALLMIENLTDKCQPALFLASRFVSALLGTGQLDGLKQRLRRLHLRAEYPNGLT